MEGLDDGSTWARPVPCRVGGGFTISRLAGSAAGADSPECLVTLVLNVGRGARLRRGRAVEARVAQFWGRGLACSALMATRQGQSDAPKTAPSPSLQHATAA